MDDTNNTAKTATTKTIDKAEIYWDSQDPAASGWWLRYHVDGTEDGCPIDAERDAGHEDLAPLVAAALDFSAARVDVATYLRGDRRTGRITVAGGEVIDWRAA